MACGRATNTTRTNIFTSITQLTTPEIIQSLKLSKTFQQIVWDENSSIPYFKQKIPYTNEENHIAATAMNVLSWNIRNLFFFYLSSQNFFVLIIISQVPKSLSRAIVADPFTRHFTTINTCFYRSSSVFKCWISSSRFH